MARRLDVELTSVRDDGTWTWRVARAKQPRGVLDGALLPRDARVGDVVRVEADFEIDGITVTSVLPAKDKKRTEPERLEVVGPPRPQAGVTSTLAPKRGGESRSRPPRREAAEAQRRDSRDGPERRERSSVTGRDRNARPEGPRRSQTTPRPDAARRRGEPAEAPRPAKPKRLTPGSAHRAAVLATLPPEHRPIAEQVLRGGIPAVRHAVEQQNARLRAEGQPEVRAEPLVAVAEQLLPELRRAEWRDRAEAAAKAGDEVALRDLRSIVAGADAAARDDESRLLARSLREALERRLGEQRDRWIGEITAALDEGRLVRALRASARPPDPGTRFPADLAVRMSEAASLAMAPEVAPDRWATLLDAVAGSPVRRSVKPSGLPAEAGDDLLEAARRASGRVPALAGLLGIPMPPPPGPARSGPVRTGGPRRSRPPAGPSRPAHPGGPAPEAG